MKIVQLKFYYVVKKLSVIDSMHNGLVIRIHAHSTFSLSSLTTTMAENPMARHWAVISKALWKWHRFPCFGSLVVYFLTYKQSNNEGSLRLRSLTEWRPKHTFLQAITKLKTSSLIFYSKRKKTYNLKKSSPGNWKRFKYSRLLKSSPSSTIQVSRRFSVDSNNECHRPVAAGKRAV